MKKSLAVLAGFLLSTSVAFAASYAYEREIQFSNITTPTSVWVPLDAHVISHSSNDSVTIHDEDGVVVPWLKADGRRNVLPEGSSVQGPVAAETVPKTQLSALTDRNAETVFQPMAAEVVSFRITLDMPAVVDELSFQLTSGWIRSAKIRVGMSESTLHDAFIGAPGGTTFSLSGEMASVIDVEVTAGQGILKIAEIEVNSVSPQLLFRASPNKNYVLVYGSPKPEARADAKGVFADRSTIMATLGTVKSIGADAPDGDTDGVSDAFDNCVSTANSSQNDRDHDGIGDACDNAPLVPNVRQADMDQDGIGDPEDNCPTVSNSDQKDTNLDGIGWACEDLDGDGVVNMNDNCVGLSNADQQDLNNDKMGDVCQGDRDSDGVPDKIDNCKATANVDQSDVDRDGIGDRCDDCLLHYDPAQVDRDGDGVGDVCAEAWTKAEEDTDKDAVPDSIDNCKEKPNASQVDTDGDGIGDTCDNCPDLQNADQADRDSNGTGDICSDADDDGVLNPYDNCPTYANPEQEDRDQDNIGDSCDDEDGDGIENARDNCPHDSNYDQSDLDQDGVGNRCDTSDSRWSEQYPWLLGASMVVIVLGLAGFGVMILKKAPPSQN